MRITWMQDIPGKGLGVETDVRMSELSENWSVGDCVEIRLEDGRRRATRLSGIDFMRGPVDPHLSLLLEELSVVDAQIGAEIVRLAPNQGVVPANRT